MERVAAAKTRAARRYFALFGAGALLSLAGTAAAASSLFAAFARSGFNDYLSLALSGDAAVYAYWRDLLLSFAESVPFFTVALLLAALGFLVWTSANAVASARRASFAF